jgi:hypothetical protein
MRLSLGTGATRRGSPAVARCRASTVLAGVWPFGVVEAVWAGVAIRRYRNRDGEAEALEAAGLRE